MWQDRSVQAGTFPALSHFKATFRFCNVGFIAPSCTNWRCLMATVTMPVCDRHRIQDALTTAPPIDTEVLFSRCMGNVAFAFVLLGELQTSGNQNVEAIELHATSDEPRAAAEAAHSLKGGAAIIGAKRLSEIAAEIEAAACLGVNPLLFELLHDLRSEMARCLAQISTLQTETQQC